MRSVRIVAMVMFALLYLGGTYAHLSGAAFPVTGDREPRVRQEFRQNARAAPAYHYGVPTYTPGEGR